MKKRPLGNTGVNVSIIGLGGMPMSITGRPSEEQSLQVIHRALDLGVTLIDTADSYCLDESDKHHNEKLIYKALATYKGDTSQVIVATKGGLMRPQGRWETNGNPKHLRKTIRESFETLGGQKPIPLWQLHAVDDKFPLEDSLVPVREAVGEGLIRFVGLSNVTVEEIERAREVVEVVSVQNQYNPWHRNPEKDGVLAYCEKNKISFFPWSPLGGSQRVSQLGQFSLLCELAEQKKTSPHQLILAWMMARSPVIVLIPGASRVSSIEDSARAEEIGLTAEELRQMDQS